MPAPFRAAPLAAAALALAVSGCAQFSADGGLSAVADITAASIRKDIAAPASEATATAVQDRVRGLLRGPLSADAAVQVALLNNRGLQASYDELRFAEASAIGDSLPPNPVFGLSRISGGGAVEIEGQIAANILALATTPARSAIAADRFRQAQLTAALDTLRIAAETRRAYLRAVASRELAGLLAQAKSTAEATSELAMQLKQSGALNTIDQSREQVFSAETRAEHDAAVLDAANRRERLVQLLGLTGGDVNLRLPGRLPALPRRPMALGDIERSAIARRVDLQILRIEIEAVAKTYHLVEATRFIDLVDVAGIARKTREPGGAPFRENGVDVRVQIPIFDFGEVRVRQAEAIYSRAVNLATEKAVNIASEARAAHHTYRATLDIAARYQRDVLPLRNVIAEQSRIRFGSGQADIFALLVEARQQIASSRAAIAAKRDFWLADADVQAVIYGGAARAPELTSTPAPTTSAAAAH